MTPPSACEADTCTFLERFLHGDAGRTEWSVAELRPCRVARQLSYAAGPSRSGGSTRRHLVT